MDYILIKIFVWTISHYMFFYGNMLVYIYLLNVFSFISFFNIVNTKTRTIL